MLQRVLHGIGTRLGARGAAAVRGRALCLDDSQARHEGCLVLLFGEGSSEPTLVAKAAPLDTARRREGKPIYQIEHENLEALSAHGRISDGMGVPEPLGMWLDGNLLVTVQSALCGPLMKNVPGRELFGPRDLGRTLDQVFAWWERLQRHVGVGRVRVDEALYEAEVVRPLRAFLSRFDTEPAERELLAGRLERGRRLLGLELPLLVRHGDLCPANIVLQDAGVAVFDWEFPLRHRLPLFDLFHFCASTRFPFSGLRGESGHFDSFRAVYWGESYFAGAVRQRLRAVCGELRVPLEALGDLFLAALIDIANLKYDALLEIHGAPRATREGLSPWEAAGGTDKDVPFARIRSGAFENTRLVARLGVPRF